jgi:hypothetical protein
METNFRISKYLLLSVIGFMGLSACNDFEELNQDPTRMTDINAAS